MTIALQTSGKASGTAISSLSVTLTTAGADRYLVIYSAHAAAAVTTINTPTWDGSSTGVTQQDTTRTGPSSTFRSAVYALDDPSVATANAQSTLAAAADEFGVIAAQFTGVAGVRGSTGATGNNSTAIAELGGLLDGDVAVDFCDMWGTLITPQGSQVSVQEIEGIAADVSVGMSMLPILAPATSARMSWVETGGTGNEWTYHIVGLAAVVYEPSVGNDDGGLGETYSARLFSFNLLDWFGFEPPSQDAVKWFDYWLEPSSTSGTVTLAQVTETDTSQAITASQLRAVAQVSETDTAQTLTPALARTVGQVAETNTAQGIAASQTMAVGQVTETDSAQAVTAQQIRAVGQVTETETAQTITFVPPGLVVGQVTETDTSQAITASQARAVGQVAEADTAQAVTVVRSLAVAQVSETDTAQAIARSQTRALGQVTEADTSQAITPAIPGGGVVQQVTEADTAQGISKRLGVAQVTEADTAQPIARILQRAVGQVIEVDTAFAIAAIQRAGIGQVVEADTAQTIGKPGQQEIAQVTETDLAQPISGGRVIFTHDSGRIGRQALRDSTERIGRAAMADATERIGSTTARRTDWRIG